MRKTIIGVIAVTTAALIALYIAQNATAQKETAKASPTPAVSGLKAVDFSLTDLEGKPVKLSDYQGKVVILDFWATWCPPCVKEIPHFNELNKTYKDKGLVVLGVSVDQGGTEVVKKFMKKTAIEYRVAMFDEATYGKYQTYLPEDERGGIPFTFIIDKMGIIRQHFVGYRPKEVFEKEIKGLL